MEFKPHGYQSYCIDQIMEKPEVALFLEMGLGKTVITLSAIRQMIGFDVSKVLVIAPLRVAQSGWVQEAQKWDHLHDLTFSLVLGDEQTRIAALKKDAQIYVINRENVVWLVEYFQETQKRNVWPFDMVVIDELSSFKAPDSKRFRAMKRVRPMIDRIVGLTGTPAPNSLLDLWAQIYLIDQGVRLGRGITAYRACYFIPCGYQGYEWRLRPGADEEIYMRICDIAVSMRAADYISLPERVDNLIQVDLPEPALEQYKTMERKMLIELFDQQGQEEGLKVQAVSAASVAGKLLQMANGAIYDEEKDWHPLHTAKLDALEEIVEAAQGQPVLCYYTFKFDLQRLIERFPKARVLHGEQDIKDWNDGKLRLMFAHPDSAGHGLNLQAGGHILVWFGLTWSLEKYQQACARLHRQGQKNGVIIHHIIARGTIDEKVMRVLHSKERGQSALMAALTALKERAAEIRDEDENARIEDGVGAGAEVENGTDDELI